MQRNLVNLTLVITVLHYCLSLNDLNDSEIQAFKDTASSLINRLTSEAKDGYNKLLRPNFGADPVNVQTSIVIDGIGPVSHEEMEFTMDFFFRQSWLDGRLAYTNSTHKYIQFGPEISDKIWKPDTYFLSAVEISVHAGGSVNSLIRIDPRGKVLVSERLRVTSKCFMTLTYFPLDTQKCSLLVGSYGYTEDDIKYSWFDDDPVSFNDDISRIQIPQFHYMKFSRKIDTHKLSTGNYSYAQLSIYLERSISVFIVQVYLPAALIVAISWVTFWVKRNAVPARASIGVTAVLTMMTLTAGGVLRDPRFTEVTPMDIYIGVCFMYVVLALVEMAFVGYFDKPRYASLRRHDLNGAASIPGTPAVSSHGGHRNTFNNSELKTTTVMSKMDQSAETSLLNHDCVITPGTNHVPARCESCSAILCRFSAPRIDIISRIFFPLTFTLFNIVYWILFIIYARAASQNLDQEEHGPGTAELTTQL